LIVTCSPFSKRELDGRLVLGLAAVAEHLLDLVLLHRGRAPRGADEIAHAGRLLDEEEDVLGDASVGLELHLDEDVAGVELGLGDLLLAGLDGLGLLGGDQDASDQVGHVLDLDLAEQRLADARSPCWRPRGARTSSCPPGAAGAWLEDRRRNTPGGT
jgi:hypothetical protein